jgi:hypothetical protein
MREKRKRKEKQTRSRQRPRERQNCNDSTETESQAPSRRSAIRKGTNRRKKGEENKKENVKVKKRKAEFLPAAAEVGYNRYRGQNIDTQIDWPGLSMEISRLKRFVASKIQRESE